jgi:ribosome maturation factor RimP
MMELPERIAQLLDEKYATDEAFSDCFTVQIELKGGPALHVFVDSDSAMTFEKCQKISRFLEGHLDLNGWLGEKYVLEVSSPGVGRPLKFFRQYVKNIGRTLEVTLLDKSVQSGVLLAAESDKIIIAQTIVERDGKKKKNVDLETGIALDQIDTAIIKIKF